MKLIEILQPDFHFADDRGVLTQLVHTGYEQVNAVFTKKGAVRGNMHYHKQTDEVFYLLSGAVRVTVSLEDTEEEYHFRTGDMFKILPLVRHNFLYEEDTYLVVLYTRGIEREDGTKDLYTDP